MNPASPSDLCAVCGDKSSGTHYGAVSCYGCKGFFRRAVIKNRPFECRLNKRCLVTIKMRCGCRYCRFQKCLQVGMKREAITEKQGDPPPKKSKTEETSVETAKELSVIDRLIEIEKRLQEETSSRFSKWASTREKVENENGIVEEMRQFSRISLDMLVEWAKTIWPFTELQFEDQCHLLRNYAAQHLILATSLSGSQFQFEVKKEDRCFLEDFVTMKNDEMAFRVLEEMVWPLREMQLQEEEFLCLKTFVFLCPEAKYLTEEARNLIRQARKELLGALFSFMMKNQPNTNFCSSVAVRYGKIILLGQALQRVTQLICQNLKMVRFFGLIELDDVLAEFIVDLPPEEKSEEVLKQPEDDNDLSSFSTPMEQTMIAFSMDVDISGEKTVERMKSAEEVVEADGVIDNVLSKLRAEENIDEQHSDTTG